MRHGLRRLDPMDFKQPIETNDPGKPGELIEVEVWRLFVNDEYQRSLSDGSRSSIRRMAMNWDWDKYTPISIVRCDQAVIDEIGDVMYEVVDGQHESIAAATNGHIIKLPAMVKMQRAVGEDATLADKASAIIGINKRIAITPFARFNMELAAQNRQAIAVSCALSFAKCQILETAPPNHVYSAGDILAIGTLKQLEKSEGEATLTRLLRIAKAGNCTPISATMLKALAIVNKSPDDPQEVFDKLAAYILGQGSRRLELIADSDRFPDEHAFSRLAANLFNKCSITKPVSNARISRRMMLANNESD